MARRFPSAGHTPAVRIAIALAAVVVLAALANAGAAAARAVVAPLDLDPLTVRGVRFRPAETVRVRVIVSGRAVGKVVRASAKGRFTVRFRSLWLTECDMYRIRASGSRGSRAVYNELPRPCIPMPP
jgi:hypothetical protein